MDFKEFIYNEGVLDRVTTLISRVIVNNIKAKEKSILKMNEGASLQLIYAKTTSAGRIMEKMPRQMGIYVGDWAQMKGADEHKEIPSTVAFVQVGEPRHNGQYDRTNKVMMMQIGVPLAREGKLDINAAIPMMKAVIRHEMEHSEQKDKAPFTRVQNYAWKDVEGKAPMGAGFGNPEAILAYMGHPSEIEAWTSGMYKFAKTAKIPFSQAVDMQIDRIADSMAKSKADPEEARRVLDNIRSQWMAYQRQRFPKAIL